MFGEGPHNYQTPLSPLLESDKEAPSFPLTGRGKLGIHTMLTSIYRDNYSINYEFSMTLIYLFLLTRS